jgi:hypothetical protein
LSTLLLLLLLLPPPPLLALQLPPALLPLLRSCVLFERPQ